MGRLRKAKRVLAQRGAGDPATLDAGSTALSVPIGPSSVEQVRWPWLLSDRGILAAVLRVAGLGVAALVGMWLIAGDTTGAEQAKLQIEALKYGFGFTAAAGAVAALLLAVRRQRLAEHTYRLELSKQDHERRKQDHAEAHAERLRELELRKQDHSETDAAERRVTDLYTKAAEQLGHADAAVRLARLYALERVAQYNPAQRQTIVNVLCAYLRMPYTPPAGTETGVAQAEPRPLRESRVPLKWAAESRVRDSAPRNAVDSPGAEDPGLAGWIWHRVPDGSQCTPLAHHQ